MSLYLNPIGLHFLIKNEEALPSILESDILKLEGVRLGERYKGGYKTLAHVTEWEEIQFVQIKMKAFLAPSLFDLFLKDIKKYNLKYIAKK